jgi:hypothetical protein
MRGQKRKPWSLGAFPRGSYFWVQLLFPIPSKREATENTNEFDYLQNLPVRLHQLQMPEVRVHGVPKI